LLRRILVLGHAAQIGYLERPADVIALGQRALKELGN